MVWATLIFKQPVREDDGFGGVKTTYSGNVVRLGKLTEKTTRAVGAEGQVTIVSYLSFSCEKADIDNDWIAVFLGIEYKIISSTRGENYGRGMTVALEIRK